MTDSNKLKIPNKLKPLLLKYALTPASLTRVTTLSVATIDRVVNQRGSPSPVTMALITEGFNTLLTKKNVKNIVINVQDIFPYYKEPE